MLNRGERVLAHNFSDVIDNAVLINKSLRIEAFAVLIAENKLYAGVYNSLTLHDINKILRLNVDIGEHIQIGLPGDFCSGILFGIRFFFQSADILALFKMESIAVSVAADINVHIFRAVLGRAQAQTVHAERKFIALALVVIVLASGIHLTENKLPIISFFQLVKIDRDTSAVILNLDRAVGKTGHGDFLSVALPRLVY